MYRIILFISFSLLTVLSFAQINFEKGYFIDNDGKKTECFIKNSDWVKNPTKFEYRINLSDESSLGSIESVQEFAVNNFSKYVRANEEIDRSKPMQFSVSDVSSNAEPDWKKETLFLKVLIEGKAILYYFEDNNFKRFFYKLNDSKIEQLIFKEYSIDGLNLRVNKKYQDQLQQSLVCDKTENINFNKISYTKNEFEKLFTKFNSCYESNTTATTTYSKNNSFFRLKGLIGMTSSNITGYYTYNNFFKDKMFSNSVSNVRIGAEFEYVLDFNKNKWALLAEVAYENTNTTGRYRAQSINYGTVDFGNGNVQFKSIDIGFGARHYMFLAKEAALFFNLIAFQKIDLNSTASVSNFKSNYENNFELAGGFGGRYKTISAEIRLRTSSSNISNSNNTIQTRTYRENQFSFIITYTLFKTNK
ncbi:MAG: hypothetical protein KGZ59_01415 [Chitinophagaceae bacterium]|nr:hypothetical protein [Chitinophagaceae bacterium]